MSQLLLGLESFLGKKGIVYFEDLITINGTKYSNFQARAAGLSKFEHFVNEALYDAASVMDLTEEERQERILRKKEQINRTT
ncbi:hypothetical protein TNCV_2742361 [Trichonephila clavipes]|nr:hypothetical protein TNCV_2742361 [Trichonephila clavipes]